MQKCSRLSAVVGLAVWTAITTGCTAPPTPIALQEDSAALDLLTRSGTYQAKQHSLDTAEELLVGRCMVAKGWAYPAQSPPAPVTYEERMLKLDERRHIGYGLFRDEERIVSPVDRYAEQLAPAVRADFTRTLLGDDNSRKAIELPGGDQLTFAGDGCIFESRTRLFPDIFTWARVTHLPETFLNRLVDSLATTPAYADAMRGWGSCMAQRGHSYGLPEDARNSLRARYNAEGSTDQLRRHEVEVAVADAECAIQVRLPQTVLTATKGKVSELSADEQQALRELTVAWLSAVATAERLLDQPARPTR